MFENLFKKIEAETSGVTAREYNTYIAQFHRVQASPGLREAAKYCSNIFKNNGIENAHVLSYMATDKSRYMHYKLFQEWAIKEAELSVSSPSWAKRRINRFRDEPMFVIERCPPTPTEGQEAEVVVLEDGTHPEDYEGKHVKDKFVLSNAGPYLGTDIERLRELAVEKHGAIGIVSDMWPGRVALSRERGFCNVLVHNRFWWMENWKKCLGFMLTPNQGEDLRKLIKQAERRGEKVKLKANVNSSFYDGTMDVATAVIPGAELPEKEILLVAHTCHSKQSANDNASGPAACLEAGRVLSKLIGKGILTEPKRSIRFLLMPEAAGNAAYLEQIGDRRRNIIAALCVNMVGLDPMVGGTPMKISRTPMSMSSYTNTLAEKIIQYMAKIYPAFWWTIVPRGMSGDQQWYNDPLIGIPMPHISHNDPYWHTNKDNMENISEEEMRKSSLYVATYAYFIANAGIREAVWLAGEVVAEAKKMLIEESELKLAMVLESTTSMLTEGKEVAEKSLAKDIQDLEEKLAFILEREVVAIRSVESLLTPREAEDIAGYLDDLIKEVSSAADKEKERISKVAFAYADSVGLNLVEPPERIFTDSEKMASKMVVERLFKGGPVPIYSRDKADMSLTDLDDYDTLKNTKMTPGRTDEQLATYWIDGERNLLEICDLVRLELGHVDVDYLVNFFPFMSNFGWFKIKSE
jgi:hypothetical protein